ncbi:hypothetical protein QTN47_14790 [Danxiaibacter flavus]|uniref:Uncharacterized protein n=1 Tax=Danxiaibacter flavus TaxID=3049108 RepID=A0ABV3ZFW6_9BACT|nr:hypothetical protein QNM32_14800 [Chitinophagaceae bacterium DXS]
MNSPYNNRDLLVLTRSFTMNRQQMDREIELLHELLFRTESIEAFCIANEVINVNSYKIIHKPHVIWRTARAKELKPFVFICNKN